MLERDHGDEQAETERDRWRRPLELTCEQVDEMFPAFTLTRRQIDDVRAWVDGQRVTIVISSSLGPVDWRLEQRAAPASPGGNSEEIPPPAGGEPAGVDRNR